MEQHVRPLAMGFLSALQSGAADVDLGTWDAGDLKDGQNISEVLKIRVFC